VSEFRFAEPHFVHGLWGVVAFVALLIVLERRGGSALEGLVAAPLQSRLVQRPGSWRRGLRIGLVGLAAACAVLALMRPQWGMRVVSASRAGAEIMIALDVSRSMLAEDVAPNRLERAKAEIVDLLAYLDGDQVGLIAFAGRASVLSPLTPDFGFLRLVLDETGPGSVTRGGTKLAEPIRKAVDGFGPSDGASRAILLITDGEDHDSFALDAAKQAAEAGIKIIAIGFGDESGSEIQVRDPRSGARTLLRDVDGRPIRTRLDGTLLRELALVTDGAYVPAGTGVLDLESIYDEHIARLTRGQLDGTRTVQNEGYSWFVLLAVVFLVASAAVSAGRLRGEVLGLLLLVAFVWPLDAQAQASAPAGPLDPAAETRPPGLRGDPEPSALREPEKDPRSIYNEAVEALATRVFEEAERLLERSRRDAKGDDELRFNASYNLGWVGVQQSGRIQAEDPQQALAYLHRAADWFREAVRLRPQHEAARRNLEVTLKRALVLADELARNQAGDIEEAVVELIERQRGVVAGVAAVLEAAHAAGVDPVHGGEALRGAFRANATAQRAVLSDSDQLAARVGSEHDALESRPEEERSAEDGMRSAQLAGVLDYLHRARERMGQARRQLRQRQGARAYRRTSSALGMLKRAHDQLRDPVAVLDQLLVDGGELARGAAVLALSEQAAEGFEEGLRAPPAWLTLDSLADGQTHLAERATELQLRFAAGLAQAQAADTESLPPEQREFLTALLEAEPWVRSGSEHAQTAAALLAAGELRDAPESQAQSLADWSDARERFLDIRGLIEATHGGQARLAEVVNADGPAGDEFRGVLQPGLEAAQERNLGRAARLADKLGERAAGLDTQVAAAEAGANAPDAPALDPESLAEEQKHVELARQVLALAVGGMDGVRKGLTGTPPVDWEWVRSDTATAIEHLETLRRLFFSITEHLRDLAQRQVNLADRTQDALALSTTPDVDATAEAAPLVSPEQQLAEQALVMATALEQQSSQAAGAAADDPQAVEASDRLRKAADHVMLAQGEMEGAVGSLSAPSDLEAALAAQSIAIQELAKALEVLEPPSGDAPGEQQDNQNGQQPAPDSPEEQAGDESGADSPPPATAEEPAGPETDPGQLLQEVRDREAKRRRERANQPSGYETVEKDW
jgi:Ca-activated chloride channel family protein